MSLTVLGLGAVSDIMSFGDLMCKCAACSATLYFTKARGANFPCTCTVNRDKAVQNCDAFKKRNQAFTFCHGLYNKV